MGKTRSLPQQPSPAAHRAASRLKQNSTFANKFNHVTGMDWSTSFKTLLLQCGWMSLNQLTVYHSLVLVYQIKTERKPEYFSEKLNKTFSKQTRLATGGGIRTLQKFRYNATQSGFLVRGSVFWNLLPPGIRQSKSMVSFKSIVRSWVTKNVGINP